MWTTKVLFDYDDDQKQPLNLIKETIGLRFTLWTELAEAMNVNSAERFQPHYKQQNTCVDKSILCWKLSVKVVSGQVVQGLQPR